MENASKALIIAGAILISIVLISLGIIVINNTQSTVKDANMDEQEIATFNAKFENYEGNKVSGAKVNALLDIIIQSNIKNEENSDMQVFVKAPSDWEGEVPTDADVLKTKTATGRAKSSLDYKVVTEINAKGYVSLITITKA